MALVGYNSDSTLRWQNTGHSHDRNMNILMSSHFVAEWKKGRWSYVCQFSRSTAVPALGVHTAKVIFFKNHISIEPMDTYKCFLLCLSVAQEKKLCRIISNYLFLIILICEARRWAPQFLILIPPTPRDLIVLPCFCFTIWGSIY